MRDDQKSTYVAGSSNKVAKDEKRRPCDKAFDQQPGDAISMGIKTVNSTPPLSLAKNGSGLRLLKPAISTHDDQV